ncbi:MAG: hypothetical protein FWD90_07155 [Defluviitaleaceae bacterium]|nr:hypothetical protein [Defluviitaleaceae bacterium]
MKNLKKKVALLLAFVMVLSLVPMNVFGRTVTPVLTEAQLTTAAHQTFTIALDLAQFRGVNTAEGANSTTTTAPIEIRLQLTGDGGNAAFRDATEFNSTITTTGALFGPGLSPDASSSLGWTVGTNHFEYDLRLVPQTNGKEAVLTIWLMHTNQAGNNDTSIIPSHATGQLLIPVSIRAAHSSANLVGTNQRNGVQIFSEPLIVAPGGGVTFRRQGAPTTFETALRMGHTDPITNQMDYNQRVPAGSIVMTENVARVLGNGQHTVILRAPEHYAWGAPGSGLIGVGGAATINTYRPAGSVMEVALSGNEFQIGGPDNRYMRVTFTVSQRPDGPMGNIADGIVIRGLWLAPLLAANPTGDVEVKAYFGYDFPVESWGVNYWHGNVADIVVGVRASAQLNTSLVGTVPNRTTGAAGDDQWGKNDWSAAIRLEETVPGAWDVGTAGFLSQLSFNVVNPGVVITGVEARATRFDRWQGDGIAYLGYHENAVLQTVDFVGVNHTAGRWNETTLNMALARVIPGVSAPRAIEVRFQFDVEPGYEANVGTDIEIAIAGSALGALNPGDPIQFVVAKAVDPVTVERVDDVAAATVSGMMNLIEPTAVSNFVLTENFAGALRANSTISVRMAGGLEGFGALLTAPTATVTNNTIRLAGPVRSGTGANTVYTWTVLTQTAGAQRAEITFSNMFVAAGFVLPSVPYYISIGGSTIAPNVGSGNSFPDSLAYHEEAIVFSVFDPNFVHGVGAPDTTPGGQEVPEGPGEGPGQGPIEPPVVNEPARLTVDTAAVNSAGQPIFITNNGRTLVNLRGLFVDVIPNGSLTRENRVSTFSAPHANGASMINISIPDAGAPFVVIGGTPVPPNIAAGYGFVLIEDSPGAGAGTWYVPMSVFTDLLGYLIN